MSIVLDIIKGLDRVAARELENCTRNLFPKLSSGADSDTKHYLAHTKDKNARASEAIALTEPINPIMQLRAHMFRGNLKNAKKMIQEITEDSHFERHRPLLAEITLEQARLSAFAGDYAQCAGLCTMALGMNPTAVSKSTLYQIRALAWYELGEFQEALRDLDAVDSLQALLPYSSSSFYSKIIRIKVESLCQGPESARSMLNNIWEQKTAQSLDPDTLLTLIRAEVDLKKREQADTYQWALASYKTAHFIGDKLYAALGKLDVLCASGQRVLKTAMNGDVAEFRRVERLIEEMSGEHEDICTTARGWLNYSQRKVSDINTQPIEAFQSLVLLSKKLVISFNPYQVVELQASSIFLKVIETLSDGPMQKALFFQKVWRMSQYRPHLHDTLVRVTLSNMRKSLKIEMKSQGGMVSLPSTIVVKS